MIAKSFLMAILCWPGLALMAQDKSASTDEDSAQLIKRHEVLSQRLVELERKLLKLSQFEVDRNKDRSDLLLKGLKLSQTQELVSDMRNTLGLLKQGSTTDLATAIKNQKKILIGLNKLYDLLESNDLLKAQRNKADQIRAQINFLEQLIQRQASLKQRIGNESYQRLKEEQSGIRKKTAELETELAPKNQPTSSSDTEPKKQSQQPEQETTDEQPAGSPEEQTAKDLGLAQKRMMQVEKALNENDPQKTSQQMELAEQKLSEAKQKLQEILKQNREEEIESTLRTLEERFKLMLQLQLKVNEDTLDLKDSDKPVAEVRIQSFNISSEQRKVILEIEKALLMLNEEGSSTAIPGTLFHVKIDLQEVVSQLELADLNDDLIILQKEVALVLAELVKSVQQEQKEQKELKKNSGQSPEMQTEQTERPLLQKLSELKIVKQLQLQLNNRHKTYAKSSSNTDDPKEKDKLGLKTKKLAERQKLLEEMALDLLEGAAK